ncbi:MAG: hypothetical protein JSV57_01140, partial [Candidatus Bathyarchaeota archaeon]
NLSFADDISAYRARTPSYLPLELSDQAFVRRLPVGAAILADQSMTTERAFVMKVRPRISEHAGRVLPPKAFDPGERAKEESAVEEAASEATQKITHVLAAPSLSITNSLATDYLKRVIKYRFSEYLRPPGEKRFTRISALSSPHINQEILGVLMGHLQEASCAIENVEDVEGTPVVLFRRENAKSVLTACVTQTSTIVAYGLSSTEEHEMTDLSELLSQITSTSTHAFSG